MGIPNYTDLISPLLKLLSDGREYSPADIFLALADEFSLSDKDRRMSLPNGDSAFENRIVHAQTRLAQAALLQETSTGHICITEDGISFFQANPSQIGLAELLQVPAYKELKQEEERVVIRQNKFLHRQKNQARKSIVQHLKHFGFWLVPFGGAIGSNFGTKIFIGGPDGEDVFNLILVFLMKLAFWGFALIAPMLAVAVANMEEDFFDEGSWNVPFPIIVRVLLSLTSLSSYLVLALIYDVNLLEKLFG